MATRTDIPDFYSIIKSKNAALGDAGAYHVLDSAHGKWDFADVLRAGGAIIFPHLEIEVCGSHYAAAIRACMNSGAKKVLGVGVLHARTDELQAARVRVAQGADVTREAKWGMQGQGIVGTGDEWKTEFSMLAFQYLWDAEAKRRHAASQPVPELIVRYPYLCGGRPHILPGIAELQQLVNEGAVVVGTADPFHHGIAYGDAPEVARAPHEGGLDLCRATVQSGFDMLGAGDYWGFNQHCVDAKSDGRDMGQTVRYILNRSLSAEIHDITWDDMSVPYNKPSPSWVAGCLITLTPRDRRATDLH